MDTEETWANWDEQTQPSVRDTSISAYIEHGESGKVSRQERLILDCLEAWKDLPMYVGGLTRRELVQKTGMLMSSVCGRVNSLLKKKLVKDDLQRPCTITKVTSHTVSLP